MKKALSQVVMCVIGITLVFGVLDAGSTTKCDVFGGTTVVCKGESNV